MSKPPHVEDSGSAKIMQLRLRKNGENFYDMLVNFQ
jgi:hypothetical protein